MPGTIIVPPTQSSDRRFIDAEVEVDLPPPIQTNLPPQGPPVSYADATSKQSKKKQLTGEEVCLCDIWEKDEQWNKEKAAAQATLDCIAQQEQDEQATQGREELQWARKNHWCESQRKLAEEGARLQEQYNQKHCASGACPNPITDLLGWCEYTWTRQERYKLPKWAADIWSASPMDHKQLTAQMVCSWGLVQAYQQTHQSLYVCPPAPHILDAYNHKVNHDTHKELSMQEHTVVQHAWALQYTSFCNDEWYDKEIAPAVHHFWDEVVKPFGSKALHNLNPSHLLGSWMHLNHGVKIPGTMGSGTTLPSFVHPSFRV